MNKTLKRREFLKTTSATAMAAMIPAGVMSSPFAAFYRDGFDPGEEFTLKRLRGMFPGYTFPAVGNYSGDAYDLKYKLYNLYGERVRDAGEFRIEKSGKNKKEFLISCTRKIYNDRPPDQQKFNYYFTGRVQVRDDRFATPLSWKCETKIATSPEAEAFMDTGHKWKGSYDNGLVHYDSGSLENDKTVENNNLTWKWGLINLVPQLKEGEELRFSTLDELDMIYGNQNARFRKYQPIDTGDQMVRFRVIDVLGDGIIPTVYWVDEADRVLFIITGMEAYVLS